MPIQSPILDDRTYQQIRDDLLRRIPVFTPEWTDFNPSDPGVTLLDLVAFQAENLLFRFNQIPDTTKLEFLRLLRIPMRPAQPARGMVAFITKDVLPFAAGEQIVDQGTEVRAGKVLFETEQEVSVWPVSVRAIARAVSPAPDDDESRAYALRAIDARGGLADDERAVYYTNRVVPDEPEAPGAEAVDFRSAVDGILWIAVMGEPGVERELLGQVLDLGVVLDEEVAGADGLIQCAGDLARARSLPLEWQVTTGRMAGDRPVYRTVSCVGDTTRGLAEGGVVQLRLPREARDLGAFPLPDPDVAGTGDLPPEIDDEDDAKRVRFWIRAFRPRGGGSIGRIAWLGVNASPVVQTTRAAREFVGTGDAQADQRYPLVHRSVVEASLQLQIEEQGDWTAWHVVDGFHASGPGDRHLVLDAEAGEIRFGTGIQGRVPQIGERIRTLGYRFGGGQQGNVAARAIDKVGDRPAGTRPIRRIALEVRNPLRLGGGADAETLVEALERVPGELRRRDRAVTRGDFREMALATPGAGVGRAEVLPRFHPPTRQLEAAGVVTVVVWPREDRRSPNAPMPDRTMIRQVCDWLDGRRLVTTELYVTPPVYRKVAVAVGVRVKPGYGIEAVRNWVELLIRQYLAPLPPYGPEGGGWPLGRRVHGPELEAAALQVEGVEYLEGLTVAGEAADGGGWLPGTVLLELDQVPELAEITVVEGPPLEPGTPLEPPDTGTVAVPIRVVKEAC